MVWPRVRSGRPLACGTAAGPALRRMTPPAARRPRCAALLLLAALHWDPATQPAVAGAATISLDFDVPRQGPVCVQAVVGDTVVFHWGEYHNLHELPAEADYTSCNFAAAGVTQLAGAGPNRSPGVTVGPFSVAGVDKFYACSKICSSHGHKVRVCVGEAGPPGSGGGACPCAEGRMYLGETSGASRGGRFPTPTPTPRRSASTASGLFRLGWGLVGHSAVAVAIAVAYAAT
mmetsp:Transcript_122243/g.346552  ORF Transcript_122243/g.346552 Transcript_122243/m.346552 type:complete len:232 (-) Transcript_122243:186-881(-)